MKKLTIATLAAGVLLMGTEARALNGFYVGANGGYAMSKVTDQKATGIFTTVGKDRSINNAVGSVEFGYGQTLGGLYVGLAAYVGYDGAKDSNLYSYKGGLTYGALLRGGFMPAPTILLYARIGAEGGEKTIEYQSNTLKQNGLTFIPGAGVEFAEYTDRDTDH